MILCWFDDSTKPTDAKITEAIGAYIDRFGCRPNMLLVHESVTATVAGIQVRPVTYVRRNNFWVGWEDIKIDS